MTTPPELDIDVTTEGSTSVVTPRGEIDYGNVAVLRTALAEISRNHSTAVVVDMAHVTFIDSTALSALVQAKQRLRELDRTMVVRQPQPRVARVLEIAGLNGYLGAD